jgi:hypothetical protein
MVPFFEFMFSLLNASDATTAGIEAGLNLPENENLAFGFVFDNACSRS